MPQVTPAADRALNKVGTSGMVRVKLSWTPREVPA
jgi:hypothetical protein